MLCRRGFIFRGFLQDPPGYENTCVISNFLTCLKFEELVGQNGSLVKCFNTNTGPKKDLEKFLREILIVFHQRNDLDTESSEVLTIWLNWVATELYGSVPNPPINAPSQNNPVDLKGSEIGSTFDFLNAVSDVGLKVVCNCVTRYTYSNYFTLEEARDFKFFQNPPAKFCRNCKQWKQKSLVVPEETWLVRFEVDHPDVRDCVISLPDDLKRAYLRSFEFLKEAPLTLTFDCENEKNEKVNFHLCYFALREEFR
jgi:hypothetical protein